MAGAKGNVTGGLLDEPYQINSRADVNRARVLPMPRAKRETKAPAAAVPSPAPAGESEQPQGGFDYVAKRNRMMKRISARGGRRSSVRSA